jgi:hypothetical protein
MKVATPVMPANGFIDTQVTAGFWLARQLTIVVICLRPPSGLPVERRWYVTPLTVCAACRISR